MPMFGLHRARRCMLLGMHAKLPASLSAACSKVPPASAPPESSATRAQQASCTHFRLLRAEETQNAHSYTGISPHRRQLSVARLWSRLPRVWPCHFAHAFCPECNLMQLVHFQGSLGSGSRTKGGPSNELQSFTRPKSKHPSCTASWIYAAPGE